MNLFLKTTINSVGRFCGVKPSPQRGVLHTSFKEHRFFVSHLPANVHGNDFFIGDIHGAFSLLSQQLQRIHFNPKTDRLICVGDLIDRGLDSFQALDWLQRPYMHSVRGNHEELYLQWWDLRHTPSAQRTFEMEVYFPNGGEWVTQHNEKDHMLLYLMISSLPYMLVVPNQMDKKIAVVHASLPDGSHWPALADEPITDALVRELLWSTKRVRSQLGQSSTHIFDEGHIPGLNAVVCGHTKVSEPTWAGKFLHLETQGWKEGGYFSCYSFDEILALSKHQ